MYYSGSDSKYHYFMARSADSWLTIKVKRSELTLANPERLDRSSSNFPGYYKVDPLNGFQKTD